MTALVDDQLIPQLRQTLLRVYDTMLANSKNTSTLPEFSGTRSSFRDWKLSFTSYCSMISCAYECELTNNPLTAADLMTFLPSAMFDPEYADENPEQTARANEMLNEMLDRIQSDVSKKLYHLIVSLTKGDARALVIQSSINPEQQTCAHVMNVLTERYHKRDINERCYLQRQLLAVNVQHGSDISKVVEQLLSRVSKLRYDLSLLGEMYEDSTIVSLVINALQSARILHTTTEMILQQSNYNCEHVFTMLRDSAIRQQRAGRGSHKTGVVLTTSHRQNGNTRKKGSSTGSAKAALYIQPSKGKGGSFSSRATTQGKGKSGGKGKGKGKGGNKGMQGPCWNCGGPHRMANCPKKNNRPQSNSYVFQVSRSEKRSAVLYMEPTAQAAQIAPPLQLPQPTMLHPPPPTMVQITYPPPMALSLLQSHLSKLLPQS